MTRFVVASAAIAVAILSAGSASASEYRVRFGDLDLGSWDGAAQFDQRVQRAARSACLLGGRVPDTQCRTAFHAEAMRGLPEVRRQDYARAQGGRLQARTPIVPN